MPRDNRLRFGKAIRSLRSEQGLSLRKFASLIGLSPTYVSSIENGKLPAPSLERVGEMAEVLGVVKDSLIAISGRIPDDVSAIIQSQPHVTELIREAKGLSQEDLHQLANQARTLRKMG